MSIEGALATIMVAGLLGMLALMAGLHWSIRTRGRAPSIGEAMVLLTGVAAVMVGVLMIVWPEAGASPILVDPGATPADPLAGYDQSELP